LFMAALVLGAVQAACTQQTPVAATPTLPAPTPEQPAATRPQEPIKAESIEDLVGTWRRVGTAREAFHRYFEDGTYTCAYALMNLEERPDCRGELWFEGTHVFDDELDPGCEPNDPGEYEVFLQPNGNISWEVIEDGCTGRVEYLTGSRFLKGPVEWEPVS